MANAAAQATPTAKPGLALFLLFIVGTLNVLDRNIVIILQEPIKAELGLTDTQLGSLTGLSFALVYCLAGAPIARLADRHSRYGIISASVAAWSALTALSATAVNYFMLIVFRMGVATGEAGGNPATISLISDLYPPEKRPLAVALWAQCQPFGTAIGFLAGGMLAAQLGWRGTLIVVGVIGLLVAPLLLLLKEPQRGAFDAGYTPAPPPSLRELGKIIFGNSALRWLLLGSGLHGFVFFGSQAWSASFYMRAFDLEMSELAFYLAIVVGVAGGIGVLLGGVLGRILTPRGQHWLMIIPAIASLAGIPLLVGQYLTDTAAISLTFGFFSMISLTMYNACINVASQALVPPTARATVTIALAYAMNLLGLALGPMVIGAISDAFAAQPGLADNALRYALLAPVAIAPFAAMAFFNGARAMRRLFAEKA